MKNNIRHIAVFAVALASALLCGVACHKDDEPARTGHQILMVATDAGQTRALLDKDSFKASGNQIRVYDYYTPANGDPRWYINDVAQSDGTGSWPFVKGPYDWTDDGVHKFFGWLEKDANMPENQQTAASFFGEGFSFNADDQTLTVTKTLSQTPDQFDFMYSDIHTRKPADDGFDAVPLQFSHLFTAFKVTATSYSSDEIILTSVEIIGLKNKKKAKIDYSGDKDKPLILYESNNDGESPDAIEPSVFEYDYKEGLQLGESPVRLNDRDYVIMWPQSKEDFTDAKIIMYYKYRTAGSSTDYKEADATIEMSKLLPDDDNMIWAAGKMNNIGVIIKDKLIELTCAVEDWDSITDEIDFSQQVEVREGEEIEWIEGTYQSLNEEEGKVIMYSDETKIATCRFNIRTPVGATWTASLIPLTSSAMDAFSIVDDSKYGDVGTENWQYVKIKINNRAPIAPQHACILRITVQTADGRTIVVKNLMPDITKDGVEEYTIIQNLING